MISQYNANHGRLAIMTQNPSNAVLCLGHSKGVVSMWTPNVKEPVARMWAHKQPLTSIAIDRSGTYNLTYFRFFSFFVTLILFLFHLFF